MQQQVSLVSWRINPLIKSFRETRVPISNIFRSSLDFNDVMREENGPSTS